MAEAAPHDATFLRLRARFVAGLGARWQEIDAARGDLATLHAALHRLAKIGRAHV